MNTRRERQGRNEAGSWEPFTLRKRQTSRLSLVYMRPSCSGLRRRTRCLVRPCSFFFHDLAPCPAQNSKDSPEKQRRKRPDQRAAGVMHKAAKKEKKKWKSTASRDASIKRAPAFEVFAVRSCVVKEGDHCHADQQHNDRGNFLPDLGRRHVRDVGGRRVVWHGCGHVGCSAPC